MKALGYLLKRNNFAAVQLVLKCRGGWSERIALHAKPVDQKDSVLVVQLASDGIEAWIKPMGFGWGDADDPLPN